MKVILLLLNVSGERFPMLKGLLDVYLRVLDNTC